MPRIVGVDIPKGKRIEIALTYICGIGRIKSNEVLKTANINPEVRAKDLTEEEVGRIASVIQQKGLRTEGDVRREVNQNIKRLMGIGCYRGIRHKKNLPCRGQSSKTNARTTKGPRRTVAGRKRAPAPK